MYALNSDQASWSTTLAMTAHVPRLPWGDAVLPLPADHDAVDGHAPDEELVTHSAHVSQALPADVYRALADFRSDPPTSGALLLTGVPVGDLPPTPAHPTDTVSKDLVSDVHLLAVANQLGQPVGYAHEHGGSLIQTIVPTHAGADQQISTSSSVSLMFHTETAFHAHLPRYLLLLCLKGDVNAATTLCGARSIIGGLGRSTIEALFEPRFRFAVDASFGADPLQGASPLRPILSGTVDEPTFIFDADLTTGADAEAQKIVEQVTRTIAEHAFSVTLHAGDLLIVDNFRAVHGRSAYTPPIRRQRPLAPTIVRGDRSCAERFGAT